MKLSVVAPINQLSYGLAAQNIVAELSKFYDISLLPIGPVEITPKLTTIISSCLNNFKFSRNAPCIRLYHQFSMAEVTSNYYNIGFPIFELDKFNERELWHLNSMNHIFVCSKWAQEVLKNNGIYQSTVIPLGVDSEIFSQKSTNNKSTVFLNVGKWEKRKGHDILADAFLKAFPTEDVKLWMLCDNPFIGNENQGLRAEYTKKLGNRVTFFDRQTNQSQIARLMQMSDCGVFPSRAEGWNLPALEMMSCGKPIIITNYSAHTEFCTSENSYLVNSYELESANDGRWFFGQGNWMKFTDKSVDELVSHLKIVHYLKQKGELKINEAGINTANQFSWKNSALKIKQFIDRL